MFFPDDALDDYVLADLSEEIAGRPVPTADPLPCDRWIARSALQKACRRGETQLAQRALANLYEYDRRSTWRHLAIIALEDVGVANVDVLARIIAAQRNRIWRKQVGGDWPVLAALVRQIAESMHCQAACDLLLRATNDSKIEMQRTATLELEVAPLATILWDTSLVIETRATAALAIGGGLSDSQLNNEPCAVFDILAESSRSTHVVATCRSAWKLTRNPMAFLLPLVWQKWINSAYRVADDLMAPVTFVEEVPGYALDQFTRVGNAISRAYLKLDPDLREMLIAAGIPPAAQPRTVGDLLFLMEGSKLKRRAIWPHADGLRLPHRQLPAVAKLAESVDCLISHMAANSSQLTQLRQSYFIPEMRYRPSRCVLGGPLKD